MKTIELPAVIKSLAKGKFIICVFTEAISIAGTVIYTNE